MSVLTYNPTRTNCTNTTTETNVLSQNIAQNGINDQDKFLLSCQIDVLNSSGSPNNLTTKIYINGQSFTLHNSSQGSSVTVFHAALQISALFLGADDPSNMDVVIINTWQPFTGVTNSVAHTFTGVDTTGAGGTDIQISAQWATADANSRITTNFGKLEQAQ